MEGHRLTGGERWAGRPKGTDAVKKHKRVWTDAPTAERCAATITLRDKSKAQCGRRAAGASGLCHQHNVAMLGGAFIRMTGKPEPPQ